jgi:predicted RNA-binding Zn-ribbon protein involved in translation (DUF1610 family)
MGAKAVDSIQPWDLIEKTRFLEQRLGMHVGYRLLEPFLVNPMDPLSLNAAASRIASFIGLSNKILVVVLTEQRQKVAGTIEHDEVGDASYIEISRDLLRFPDAVLATIAHEVTHAFMKANGISLGGAGLRDVYENEILTDVCAVFMGLGKILLNGTETQYRYTEPIPGGTREVTQTQSVGYLKPGEMAFVYRFICAARKAPSSTYEVGLSPSRRDLVRACEREHSNYFESRFHGEDVLDVTGDRIRESVAGSQAAIADLAADMTYLMQGFVTPALETVRQAHINIKKVMDELDPPLETGYDPVLQFIARLKVSQSMVGLADRIAEVRAKVSEELRQCSPVIAAVEVQVPACESLAMQEVLCPIDGIPIALRENESRAHCPKCGYSFIVHGPGRNRHWASRKPAFRWPWSRRPAVKA